METNKDMTITGVLSVQMIEREITVLKSLKHHCWEILFFLWQLG